MALVMYYDTNGIPQPVDVTDGYVHVTGDALQVDGMTRALPIIEYEHHEIHSGSSFHAYFNNTTAATSGHRSGLYIKTPATGPHVHMVVEFSASVAANMSVLEAPTIAANTGTHGVSIFNRYRDSIKASGCFDNATVRAVNKCTTLNETQINGDGSWATGTVIMTEPLVAGSGPKPAGGSSRGEQEWILKANTAYVFLITNTVATANVHHISIDFYEHTNL